jgi:hypothetical protein
MRAPWALRPDPFPTLEQARCHTFLDGLDATNGSRIVAANGREIFRIQSDRPHSCCSSPPGRKTVHDAADL